MLNAETLTFREFAMDEPLLLSTIQDAVLEFLRGRDDVVIFGAQAVNAYVDEPRMTQDVDLLSTKAKELSESLRLTLHERFQITVRVRNVANGKGFRIFQIRKEGNRHLVDIRSVDDLPKSQRISDVLVMSPVELVASKVVSSYQRRGRPKSFTDQRDIAYLLLAFPDLKTEGGAVSERLMALNVSLPILEAWSDIVSSDIRAEDDEDEFF